MSKELKSIIYEFIANYIIEKSIGPSIKEITIGVEAGESNVRKYLKILEQEKLIIRNGTSRYYELPMKNLKSSLHYKSLENSRPDIFDRLDFRKLKEMAIDPHMISLYSNKKYPFICNKNPDHKFEMILTNMVRHEGFTCLYCKGYLFLPEQSLAQYCITYGRMHLLDEYSNRNDIKANEIKFNSAIRVNWRCLIHEFNEDGTKYFYKKSVKERVLNSKGCPKCNKVGISFIEVAIGYYLQKQLICENNKKFNGYKYDHFIKELYLFIEYDGVKWHKNDKQVITDGIKNELITSTSKYRLLRIRECGCPDLHNTCDRIIEIKSEYKGKTIADNSINGVINNVIFKINQVYNINLNIDVNVQRDFKEIYETYYGTTSKYKVKILCPNILDFLWDKNQSKVIGELSIYNQIEFGWKCNKCGQKYNRSVCNQMKYEKSLCNDCRRKNELEERSIEKYEHINKMLIFDEELNGIGKKEVYAKSGIKYWFRCKECGHVELIEPYKVYDEKNPIFCRNCCSNGKKLTFEKSIAAYIPDYIIWDVEKNNDRPEECFKTSREERWFIDLRCNHSFLAEIRNIARGSGCNKCKKKHKRAYNIIPEKGYSLAEVYPEVFQIWDYDRNSKTPYDYKKASGKKVFIKNGEKPVAICDLAKSIIRKRNNSNRTYI